MHDRGRGGQEKEWAIMSWGDAILWILLLVMAFWPVRRFVGLASKRACGWLRHFPKRYSQDGSWSFGFGGVCAWCGDGIDSWPQKKIEAAARFLDENPDYYPGHLHGRPKRRKGLRNGLS